MGQAAGALAIAGQIAGLAAGGYSLYQSIKGSDVDEDDYPARDSASEALKRGMADYIEALAVNAPHYVQRYRPDIEQGYRAYHQRRTEDREG